MTGITVDITVVTKVVAITVVTEVMGTEVVITVATTVATTVVAIGTIAVTNATGCKDAVMVDVIGFVVNNDMRRKNSDLSPMARSGGLRFTLKFKEPCTHS